MQEIDPIEGILLIDKPRGKTSFSLVYDLRKCLLVKKIGHAGTLDPFATGVMVMLIGKKYTRLSDTFLTCDKEYIAELFLGEETDTYDCEGQVTFTSPLIPSLEEIKKALHFFQGEIDQIPPMFSAKKQGGKKLYELARQGQVIERPSCKVTLNIQLLNYHYPYLKLNVSCSKGTYIRSLAYDLGQVLKCGAHLSSLIRTRSGEFRLDECIPSEKIKTDKEMILQKLLKRD